MAFDLRCNRHWVASTWPTSDVPMPKARAPKAPCVAVWLSPQTTVMPGWVRPSSGPMTWTTPRSGEPQPARSMPWRAQFPSSRVTCDFGLGRDIGPLAVDGRQGRGRVVQGGEGPVRTADLQPPRLDLGEGLGAGDLVDQMQVDIEHARRLGRFRRDDVGVPDLVEQGAGRGHAKSSPTGGGGAARLRDVTEGARLDIHGVWGWPPPPLRGPPPPRGEE